MFFFVFGLPGGFTGSCERIACALLQRAGNTAAPLRADTLEDVALRAIGTGVSHAVVSSSQPGGRLRASLVEGGRNFIVALDDPSAALTDLVLGQGVELPSAVRQVASSCAALGGFAEAPGALTLMADRDDAWPSKVAGAIAHHFGLSLGSAEVSDLVRDIPDGGAASRRYDAVEWWNGLDAANRELASGALAPFVNQRPEAQPISVSWRQDLFFLGDRLDARVAGPVDITGRARCLLQGPYIMLPPGSWSLSLTASFLQGAAEHEFAIDLFADGLLASGTINPQHEGTAEATLDFSLGAETEQPIVIRISSRRAAFDGAIVLVGATLVQAAPGGEGAAP